MLHAADYQPLPRYAILVAGGKGCRMGADIPKQFLPVGGWPVLMHTLRRWLPLCQTCVLVLPKDHHAYWQELCHRYRFQADYLLATGGDTRFQSVQNGLAALPAEEGLVAVHDGVRPLVSAETIECCFDAAAQHAAAVPVMPPVESLRHTCADGRSHAVPRSEYAMVQTPQTFDLALLREAYTRPYQESFTDDASVFEAAFPHHSVQMVLGNVENIKLTTPIDLRLAEIYLSEQR